MSTIGFSCEEMILYIRTNHLRTRQLIFSFVIQRQSGSLAKTLMHDLEVGPSPHCTYGVTTRLRWLDPEMYNGDHGP